MSLALKPTHAAVKNYSAALTQVGLFHFTNEAQVSDAFAKLLIDCGKKLHLTFIPADMVISCGLECQFARELLAPGC
jgi:hypothetical protein